VPAVPPVAVPAVVLLVVPEAVPPLVALGTEPIALGT
jgi:hypothetical protein